MKQQNCVHRITFDSSTFSCPNIFWSIHFLVFLITTTNALVKLPKNTTIPALLVFGDSIVDAGNNNDMLVLARCNYHPYGIDFEGGVPTGRFSNGKVSNDFLAEELGIKPTIPAYRDPNLKPEDLLTGVTFASGGAGYIPVTSKLAGAISLSKQLQYFEEYIEKLKGMVGEEKTKHIIENSLFSVVYGSNDIDNTYFDLPITQLIYDVDSFTTLLAEDALSFIQKLYEHGARRILVNGIAPLGCIPSKRTSSGGPLRHCSAKHNDAAKLFNDKLSANIDKLSRKLQEKSIIYVDNYSPLLEIITTPKKYGFKVVDLGCCGTGLFEVAELCNKFSTICPTRTDYVFWDSFHPTEKTYRILAANVLEKYINKFF
ncbi:GDSL esterase/lipase EXL1 [Cardamine amara subsp. amara]|uniref:GDSL esterase/lipase EXL1 n=1 Tax=Cardamine amara subsp. amara TaxID=228776 RepID=A0ABD1B1D9_CARAN